MIKEKRVFSKRFYLLEVLLHVLRILKFNQHQAAVKAIAWSPHQHGLLLGLTFQSISHLASGWPLAEAQLTGLVRRFCAFEELLLMLLPMLSLMLLLGASASGTR